MPMPTEKTITAAVLLLDTYGALRYIKASEDREIELRALALMLHKVFAENA